MSEGNGRPIEFKVSLTGKAKSRLKLLHSQAANSGRGKQFVEAFRRVIQKLQTEALGFGEPLYHLPALKLLVRKGILTGLVVYYAVHSEKHQVFILGFEVLS